MVTTQDGRLTVRLADAHYAESETQTTSTSMRGSRISSSADIDIAATAGSVAIIGSDLAADADGDGNGDINLSAAQNIDIREASDTASTQSRTITGDAELSLVIQNQAVEVVKAYERLEDAKEQLEESKRQYKDYERNLEQLEQSLRQLERDLADKKPGVNYADIVELRALIDDVKDDKEWYQAGIALASLNLVSASTALAQQTAVAAQSTATWGFNAGLQLDIDTSQTQNEYQSTTAVASTVSGQNIRLNTGNGNTAGTQTNIQGSHLLAINNIAITTGDLNVTASKNTAQSSSETQHGHITAQMTVYGAAGGASVNASVDRSQSSARETTHNNSILLADSIDISTSGDTTLRGATVRAESELNADIGGNLTVESVQDRSSSRNSSAGISGGYSLGGTGQSGNHIQGTDNIGALSGVNAGANSGNGMSNTRQTVLTSLTSGGTANINVQNHTQITGALIATTDDNGHDLSQLNLSTNTIGFADLRDRNVSSQTSAGLSTNVGIGDAQTQPGQPNTAQNNTGTELLPGTSNLTYHNSQQNSASKQLATLGHGTISVGGTVLEQNGELTDAGKAEGSALAGLNRDTTHTTNEMWNSDYSQNIDVTVDHRLFTDEGHKQIKEDAKRTEILGDAILDLADSSVSFLGFGEGETYLLGHIQNKQDFFSATKYFAADPTNADHISALTSGVASPEQKDAAYTALANCIALQLGIDPVQAMTLVQEHYNLKSLPYDGTNIAQIIQGAYAPDPSSVNTGQRTGLIFLVDDNIGNTADAVRILGHETSHHLDANRNPDAIASKAYSDNRESYANIMGDATVDYVNFSFAANGYSALGAVNSRNGSTLHNPTIAANNAHFNRLDPSTVEYRQLAIPEIQYVRDQDRVDRFAEYLKTTTGEELTAQQAQARLLQGSAGLMDAKWQEIYGTDATVMDFLMTEVANDIKSVQGSQSSEHTDALLLQQLLNSDLAYTDPRTGERRLVFTLTPGEFSDERNGVTAFMSSDTIGLIDELGVPKNPQQRILDNLAGRTQGQSDAFANTGGTLVDIVTGAISGLWNLVSSPVDTVRESWNEMKEFDAYGTLLGYQGRDYERGYIQGQGDGNAAIGTVAGEALAAFGGALLQGALVRANGGTVIVAADANGQATGFSIHDASSSSRNQKVPIVISLAPEDVSRDHIGAAWDKPTNTRWNPSAKDQNCIACVGSYMTDKDGMFFMTADDIERTIASVDPSRAIQLTEAVRIIRTAAKSENQPITVSPFSEHAPAGEYAIFVGPDRTKLSHVFYAERTTNGDVIMFDPQNGQTITRDDLMSLRLKWGGAHDAPIVPVLIKGAHND